MIALIVRPSGTNLGAMEALHGVHFSSLKVVRTIFDEDTLLLNVTESVMTYLKKARSQLYQRLSSFAIDYSCEHAECFPNPSRLYAFRTKL